MKKIFVHIGIGKTATSAIQNLSFRAITEESNTKYFPFGLIGDVHNLLSDFHPNFNKDSFNEAMLNIKTLDKDFNYLISSEFLAYSSSETINSLRDGIIDAGFELEVVLVIRNFSDLMFSSYLQALKSGFGLYKGESIIDYSERMKSGLNYLTMLDKWGECSVKIIDFDANKKDIINVFFDALDIKIQSNISFQEEVNTSLMCEFIPLVRRFDSVTPKALPDERKKFINMLLDISKQYSYLSDHSYHKGCIKSITDEMQITQYSVLNKKYCII